MDFYTEKNEIKTHNTEKSTGNEKRLNMRPDSEHRGAGTSLGNEFFANITRTQATNAKINN